MNITAVRQAIANQITAVIGAPLTAYPFQPDMPTVPAVWVKVAKIEYDRTMRHGMEQAEFELVVVVSSADDQSGQASLDQYIHGTGALSIKAAVEAGRQQYGGNAYVGVFDDCWVSSVDSVQQYAAGAATFFGATFHLLAIGDGNL